MNSFVILVVVAVATCVVGGPGPGAGGRGGGRGGWGGWGDHGGWSGHGGSGGWHGGHGSSGSSGDCSSFSGPQGEEKNKRVVQAFHQEVYGDLNINATDKYLKDPFIQHNPFLADGVEAFKTFAGWFLKDQKPSIFKPWRVAADGDLVWVHKGDVSDKTVARAAVDIYRLDCGKIVEHWDVLQSANAPFANSHPMN